VNISELVTKKNRGFPLLQMGDIENKRAKVYQFQKLDA
jgi:hypothetical protein